MPVLNVHGRELPASADAVGQLLDTLAGPDDRLWPWRSWPPMQLDGGLEPGSRGGHGPIRYTVAGHQRGRWVRWEFTGPRGFDGFHEFTVTPVDGERSVLTHRVVMRLHGSARVTWPVLARPLHDALIEDALGVAESAVDGTEAKAGGIGTARPAPAWGWWVRVLRRLAGRGSRR